MNSIRLRETLSSLRAAFGLGPASVAFFLVLVALVLGNAAVLMPLLSEHGASVRQVATLDEIGTQGQRLALQALRLSDGADTRMDSLSRGINAVEVRLQALERGGEVAGKEIFALVPPAADRLPQVRHDWNTLRGRLQAIILNASTANGQAPRPATTHGALQRQGIATDSMALLDSLDVCRKALVPWLLARTDAALAWGIALALVDLLALLLGFVALQRYVVRPLRELRQGCTGLLQGRFDLHVSERGMGDLGSVARAFNEGSVRLRTMLDKLHEEQQRLERSDVIFRGLARNPMAGIFLVEADRFSFVSDKMAEIFGYEAGEMVGSMSLLGIVAPPERYPVAEAVKSSQSRKDGTLRFERQGLRRDGAIIDIEVFGTTIHAGEQVTIIGLVQDVTERKRAESSAQLAAIAYENSSEAIAITDASGVIIDVNPAYSLMTGYWSQEVAGKVLPLLQPGHYNRDFYDEMWHLINTQGRWEGEYWSQRKSGERYAERATVDTAWNHDGSINCRVAMLSDVTQKKQVEVRIWEQAHHDALTGLPNRQYFSERLQQAVSASEASHKPLALLFLDLDLFKEVNDSMGHAVGDQLLVEVAHRMQAVTREKPHFVARLGGDEFVVIVCDAPARPGIDALCESILGEVTRPYALAGKTVSISASLGVALYPQDANDAETLLRHVDMAMYAAKTAERRGGYRYFDTRMRERARMQRDLLYSLPQAIEAGQFFLLYQPIYSLRTGLITSAEMLLRWDHPELGVVSPLDFIVYAEERHLIGPLSRWVFSEAARQLAHWRTLSPQLRLTLNVASSQLAEDRFDLLAVLDMLASHDLPPDGLLLECSEYLFLEMDDETRQRLQRMGEAGLRFCVGAVSLGLSALLSLPRQSFEALKLEREATERLLTSEHASIVCEAVITLAHRLGLSVIAEGVTSQEQYEFLRNVDCDAGQGYWFDEPLDKETFEQRLRTGARWPRKPAA